VTEGINIQAPAPTNRDRLDAYIDTLISNSELAGNAVLSGYFYAIFDSMMQREGKLIIDCLYDKDRLASIMRIVGQPSIAKLVSNMLTFNDNEDDEYEDEAFDDGYVKPLTLTQKYMDSGLVDSIVNVAVGDDTNKLVAIDRIISAIDDDCVRCSMAIELIYSMMSYTECLQTMLDKMTSIDDSRGSRHLNDANKYRLSIINRILSISNLNRRQDKCTSQSPLALANNHTYKQKALASSLVDRLKEDGNKYEYLRNFFVSAIDKISAYLEQVELRLRRHQTRQGRLQRASPSTISTDSQYRCLT
jgi:hypothetical protein